MKKILVIFLVLFHIKLGFSIELGTCSIPYNSVVFPSFTTLIKVVYISIKINIKNLTNLIYIFSNLPQKKQNTNQRKNYKIVFLINPDYPRKKISDSSMAGGYYYNIIKDYLIKPAIYFFRFIEPVFVLNTTKSLYYFSKPRSSI